MAVSRGAGRPAYVPTAADRDLVKRAAAAGIPHSQIALLILHHEGKHAGKPIGERTLERHYGLALKMGKADAHMNVGRAIYIHALQGNAALAIWYTKSQMGWRDPNLGSGYGYGGGGGDGQPGVTPETLAAKLREAARAIKMIEDAPPPEFAVVREPDADEA